MTDILSWYITKLFHPFAIVVMLAGGLMGVCFAFMWVTTMWQLWFSAPPKPVTQRVDGENSAERRLTADSCADRETSCGVQGGCTTHVRGSRSVSAQRSP